MSRNPETHRMKQRANRKRYYALNSLTIAKEKAKGCTVCGLKEELPHRRLGFDHLNPKVKNAKISRLRWFSPSALAAELCHVRCTCEPCHKDRHRSHRMVCVA